MFSDQSVLQVIESLAFEEEPPEFTEKDDFTIPDNEGILNEAREELIAFRVSYCTHPAARLSTKAFQ